MKINPEEFKDFEEKLNDYVMLQNNCAVLNERNELGMTMDIYDLEEYNNDLQEVAKKHEIKIFQVAEESDYDELNMYVCHIENVIINALYKQIIHFVQYKIYTK